ncbi:MAG: hypothetical protein ACXVDA_14555 [Ktedonobacterales bacterium]
MQTQNSEEEFARLRTRVRDLEHTLNLGNKHLRQALKLPPALSDLLGLLLSLPTVSVAVIQSRLEISTDAKVTKHRLKKKLEPFGIVIQSAKNVGYWLDEADKVKVRQLMAEAEAEASVMDDKEPLPS